jgi:hypothetical protein
MCKIIITLKTFSLHAEVAKMQGQGKGIQVTGLYKDLPKKYKNNSKQEGQSSKSKFSKQ